MTVVLEVLEEGCQQAMASVTEFGPLGVGKGCEPWRRVRPANRTGPTVNLRHASGSGSKAGQ
jgi:hypothetical protein